MAFIRDENKLQRTDRLGQSTLAFECDKFSLVGKFNTPSIKVTNYVIEAAAISITANWEHGKSVFYTADVSNSLIFLFAAVWVKEEDPSFKCILLYFLSQNVLELLKGTIN
jgi:hypothetical protein